MARNTTNKTSTTTAGWGLILLLCLVQIGTTSDTSILANSMSALVAAFHTSVASVQLANTIYPVITGAFMMLGGVIGIRIGWKKLLFLGLLLLAIGEFCGLISPNITFFTFVARVVAGLGASMAVPAILGITMVVYAGRQRMLAFSAMLAANGLASALGPIVGGWVIVEASWRFNYLGLCILFIIIFLLLLTQYRIKIPAQKIKIDVAGAILIAIGLVLLIFGAGKMSAWGVLKNVGSPFTIFGLSPCPFIILVGILFIWFFSLWENFSERHKRAVLLPMVFIRNQASRGGLMMNAVLFFILGGAMFIVVTYLQMVVGLNAVVTGLILLFFAVGVTIFSIAMPLIFPNASARLVCQIGIVAASLGCILMLIGLERTGVNWWWFVPGFFVCGSGVGLLSSQASSVVANAVPGELAQISAGVQGASRNIGNGLGIGVIGLILIMALTTSVKESIAASPNLPQETKHAATLIHGVPFESNMDMQKELEKYHLKQTTMQNLLQINLRSRLVAARISFLSLALIILFCLWWTTDLPGRENEISPG